MPYRDSNGRITIDEVAANNDIRKLRQSIEHMQAAIGNLQEILAQAESFSGNTADQIRETTNFLIRSIRQSISDSEAAISQIQSTVAKYRRIDEELKQKVILDQ